MKLAGVIHRRPFGIRGLMVFLTLCLSLAGIAVSSFALQGFDERSEISREDLEALINRPNTSVTRGTLEVIEGEVIEGNVAIIEGDLEMQSGSTIKGDVIVLAGDALLNGKCVIEGDLRVVAGFLYASALSEIRGRTLIHDGNYTLEEMDEATGKVKLRKVKDVNRRRFTVSTLPGPFNRVDGHNFDFIVDYKRPEGVPGTSFEGTLRIPTEDTHDGFVQFKAALKVPLMEERLEVRVDGSKITKTEDAWRTGDFENSLVAFFTSNDDRDYYEETGGGIGAAYEITDEVSVLGGISSAEFRSLGTRSPFTIVQRTDYRKNPPVFGGHLTELSLVISYDTRFDPYFPSEAWLAEGGLRSGLDFLDGERTYTILEATVRRHQKLTQSDFLDLRFKIAGATDVLPAQRTFSFGSLGAVRGKTFNSWDSPRGDRLLLANLEYRRRLKQVRFIESLFSSWWLVAFYDAGALFVSDDPEDFGTLFSDAGDHAGSGAGLGVSGSSFLTYVGLFLAKDLDTDSWRFIVRLNRPF